jgi:hypothetical protein
MLEHPLGSLSGEAGTAVFDRDRNRVLLGADDDGDGAVGGGVAEGIGEQVVENALDFFVDESRQDSHLVADCGQVFVRFGEAVSERLEHRVPPLRAASAGHGSPTR